MKKALIEQIIVNIIIILLLLFVLTKTNDVISFIIIMIPLIWETFITAKYIYKKVKYIKSFEKETIAKIEDAIQNPIFDFVDYVLTDKFIFNKCNLQIINYTDIYLLKKDWTASFGRYTDIYDCIYIVTNKGNYCLRGYKTDFTSFKRAIDEFLLAQNKEILIDDTKENKKILKEKYNIDLKKHWKLKAKRTRKIIRFYF